MPYGITQCYLPPSRGDIPAFTPAKAGTRFSDPEGMQGWVDPGGWLEMVYPLNGHPSWTNWARCWLTSLMRPINDANHYTKPPSEICDSVLARTQAFLVARKLLAVSEHHSLYYSSVLWTQFLHLVPSATKAHYTCKLYLMFDYLYKHFCIWLIINICPQHLCSKAVIIFCKLLSGVQLSHPYFGSEKMQQIKMKTTEKRSTRNSCRL